MMELPLHTFLADLAVQGIRLSVHDGRLRCDAPRDRLTPALREALAARKPEIVSLLSRSAPDRMEPAPAGPAPLSLAQQRLWVLAQMDEDSAAYNMRTALRITGPLDQAALEAALAAVVRRHAVLRTAFSTSGSEPAQVVHEGVELTVDRVDLGALCDTPGADAALEQVLTESALTPFDLGRPPLVRAAIVRTAPLQHVLVLTLHHLVADGASLGILAAEIAELYTAAVRTRPPRLPALPVQYADFAAWQRRRLDPARLEQLRAYWLGQLAGAPPRLELPTDHPRKQERASRRGATERFVLPPALAEALRRTSQASGTTMFATLLTGFALLMARYANQDDVVIGAPASLRDHPDVESLIGMFVNTVVLRVRLDGDPTLEELLHRVRQTVTGAYAHADYPLDHLVEALQPERSPEHHPVFQVMFIHDNAPAAIGGVADLDFEILEHRTFDAKFDLMLAISEAPDGIRGLWEYRRDLFEPATITRATQHLLRLLEALALTPRTRVLEAPLLSGAERHQVLRAWNQTDVAFPDALPVHRLFERQAAATPHAIAVRQVAGAEQWTYAELDQRASRIAAHLAAQGVGPGHKVAVLLPRSPDLLAALLGVWKAGAAYIPMDPSYPGARLSFMLADARPACLVTTAALAARLDDPPDRVVRLDRDPLPAPAAAPAVDTAPADAAYLMYTSGSTGRPKAAIISHAALGNYLRWCVTAYAVERGTGSVVGTSIAFDATVTSLYTPLLVGRPVLLLPEGDEIQHLATLLSDDRPLAPVKLTPAHLDALRAATGEQLRPGGAHVVVVGGEQLLGEQVAWCRTMAPEARVFNEYGPTETTVGCCVYEVPPGPLPDVVPIGRPIANTRLYVLNERLEPAPTGVTGELYIAGHGVARGYLDRPELDAERFVPDPFAPDPDARMYRTGDLAFWSPDGNLRFVGRRDGQVKLRGYRIELTEIEAALLQHPDVRQAAVVVRTGAGQRPHLAAFLVAGGPATPDSNALRELVARQLPEPMVPAVFQWVEALPLTPNGKVDRAALSAAPAEHRAQPVPAATAEQQVLIELWCALLGREHVSPTDNFFALGGDSILGIQLVARARERGLHFTPRDLVEHQTVAELARVVRSESRAPAAGAPAAGPAQGPVVTTPIQRWFFAQALPEPHHYNQSVLIEVPGDIDAGALETALRALVEHHDALRMRFTPAGEATLASAGDVTLDVVDLSALPAGERGSALEAAADARQRSLALAGPLFGPTLFRLGHGARLLLAAHHLIVDGVSWRILLEDLVRAYEQAAARKPVALPPRTSSVQTWGRRIQAWAGSAALAQERAIWARAPELPGKRLPVRAPGASEANLAGDAAMVTCTLTAAETEQLRAVRALADADVQEVLVAALARAFTDRDDASTLTVDLESHGRAPLFDDVDLSRTVGWFTAVYPVHLELRGAASPAETLRAVCQRLRAVPGLGVGYGVLRYFGGMSEPRPAQVRFNYFGQLDRAQPTPAGWRLASESCGAQRSPAGARAHLIEIDTSILDGCLTIEWRYAGRVFERATIESLVAAFERELRTLVRHCHEASAPRPEAISREHEPWSPLVLVGKQARALTAPARAPLFCVPGAAMDVISLQPLALALGPDQTLYGLQPRGLDGAAEPHRTVEEMAACNLAAVRTVQPHGPYHLAGHSFGAYVAYEMAQQLREAGEAVAMLAVFDAEARDRASAAAAVARSRTDRLQRLLSLVQRFAGRELPVSVDALSGLAPEQLVGQVALALVEAGIVPADVGPAQVERYLRVGEASALAYEAYQPAGRHAVRTLLFRARDRHADDARLGAAHPADETLGWRGLAHDATTHWVPGDHVTLLTQHVREVAAILRDAIHDRQVAA